MNLKTLFVLLTISLSDNKISKFLVFATLQSSLYRFFYLMFTYMRDSLIKAQSSANSSSWTSFMNRYPTI